MSEKKPVYSRRAHSVCCLTYHAVFVVKYRRKVISPGIMDFFKVHTKYLTEERFKRKSDRVQWGVDSYPV